MKHTQKHTGKKNITPKGDRLQWGSLKEVKTVPLTAELTKGKLLSNKDLEKRANGSFSNKNVLVP